MYQHNQPEKRTDLVTKIPNIEAHLITGDINIKHAMIGATDLLTNRTGEIIEHR